MEELMDWPESEDAINSNWQNSYFSNMCKIRKNAGTSIIKILESFLFKWFQYKGKFKFINYK